MSQKIKFIARDPGAWELAEKPYPANQNIPEWWRNMSPYMVSSENPEGKKFKVRNRMANTSPKKCVPMLDALTSGYLIPLWADVSIEQTDVNPLINWRTSRDVFEIHGDTSMIETPIGYHKQVFKFMNLWSIITPPGYSCLISAPAGFRQTGLQAIPAIIDTDKSTLELVFPLWIQKDFNGIVEKGTPLVQITPFKRSEWKAEYTHYKHNEYQTIEDKNFNATLINHYIKKVWSKKKYL
jgi:hypothetical protein